MSSGIDSLPGSMITRSKHEDNMIVKMAKMFPPFLYLRPYPDQFHQIIKIKSNQIKYIYYIESIVQIKVLWGMKPQLRLFTYFVTSKLI